MIKSSEIKRTALNQLKGKWPTAICITTLFTLVNIALSYILTVIQNATTFTPILYYAANIIYLAIFLPLSFGLVASLRKLTKNHKIDITNFLNEAFLNTTNAISIFISTLLKILLPSLIILAGITGILFMTLQILPLTEANASGYALYIVLLYFIIFIGIALSAIPYALSSYILSDNKELKTKEIIMQSALLMENKKWNFISLILSFFGWILILSVVATIAGMLSFESMANYVQWFGMIFLMPYIIISISVFYEETLDSKEIIENNSKN